MRHKHRLVILGMLIQAFAIPAAADSGAMLFQLRHDFGDQSVTRIELRVVSEDRTAPIYAVPAVPILSSNADEITIMNLDQGKDSSRFCDRHRSGCLAVVGTVMFGAILYSAEKAHTKELFSVPIPARATRSP